MCFNDIILINLNTIIDDSDSPDSEASPVPNTHTSIQSTQQQIIHSSIPNLQPPQLNSGASSYMQQIMMYPHMNQMVNMNQIMMQQMMSIPSGMMPPHPPIPGQVHPPPPPPPPPLKIQHSTQSPQPLMSLMGVNTKPPTGHISFSQDQSAAQNLPLKHLFPAAATYSNQLNQQAISHLNVSKFGSKLENPSSDCKIVHPDEDISLVNYFISKNFKLDYCTIN